MSLLGSASAVPSWAVSAIGEFAGVVVDGGSTDDAIEELLLSVARGDHDAFIALKERMGGLVRVNIRRVLGDASRADAVTQEFFAEVFREAVHFDPELHSAQAWLLTRAHHRAIDLVSELTADEGQPVLQGTNATSDQVR